MKIRASLACLAWLLLGSCGGGGGGGEGNTLPLASTPSVSFGDKQLHFAWTAATGATFYRLSESTDGVAAYAVVIDNLAVTHYDFVLTSLFAHINAKFKLEACNSNGCTPSVLNMPDNLSTALGAYVKASNTGGGDNFGSTVAISADGNTMAVGAPGESSAASGINNTSPGQGDDSASISGAVYVFFRSGGTWTQQAYIKASNTGANDFFGFSVSLSTDGSTLAVGAVGEASAATGVNDTSPGQGDDSVIGAGAVYVFTRSGAAWSQQAYIKSLSHFAGDFFGFSVALSLDGSTLAVGVPFENSPATGVNGSTASDCGAVSPVNCAENSGAVYVYTRSGTAWSEQAYLKASNTGAGDQFGFSVSLTGDGNLLAVGAPGEDSVLHAVSTGAVSEGTAGNGAMDAGAVYTFKRVNSVPATWSQDTYVKATNAGAGDGFGTAVALSSDAKTLAVGAPNEDSDTVGVSPTNPAPGNNDSALSAGAVYVFNRILTLPNTWAQQAYIKASNTASSAIFGVCMALSGDGNTLAVGAADAGDIAGITPGAPDVTTTHNSLGSSGAVYRFTRAGPVWTQQAYVKATNLEANDFFGVTELGSGVIALSSDGSAMAVGAVHEGGTATGVGGNQTNDCTTAAPTNCAGSAGAVYLY
jgi:hypothetical protein